MSILQVHFQTATIQRVVLQCENLILSDELITKLQDVKHETEGILPDLISHLSKNFEDGKILPLLISCIFCTSREKRIASRKFIA